MLSERTGKRVEILVPQRGEKRSLVDLVCQNAKQSYDQRFRVLQPAMKAIQEALQDALTLEELPRRIECFDISHIQGAETVASMVVWEDGAMKKSDYRKFQVKTVSGVDDFASMREVIQRRYKRLQEDKKPFPSLILIDGGLGQLHAAYAALEEIGITLQPLASIAKREEIIYVYGQENEPVVLDRRSPVLHLMQKIRDESHRFAVTYHRKRRQMRDRDSELLAIPGVGPRTRQRLIEHFGSIRGIRQAGPDALTAVVNAATAKRIRKHFDEACNRRHQTRCRAAGIERECLRMMGTIRCRIPYRGTRSCAGWSSLSVMYIGGNQEDERAEDPHDDRSDHLIGKRRELKRVWLRQVIRIHRPGAEGEERGERRVDDVRREQIQDQSPGIDAAAGRPWPDDRPPEEQRREEETHMLDDVPPLVRQGKVIGGRHMPSQKDDVHHDPGDARADEPVSELPQPPDADQWAEHALQ